MCENAYITDLEFDEFIAGCSKFSEVKEKLSKKFELFDATVFGLTAAWLNLNLGCWFVRGATLRSLWTRRHLYAHRCFGYMAWEWPNWMAACLQDYNISQYEAALSSNRRQKGKEAVSSAVSSRRSTPSNASELTPVPADLEDVPATNDNEIIANQLQSDLKTTDGNSQGGDRAPVLASSAAPTASKKRKGMSREMASLGVASSDKVDINAPRQKRNRRK